jgi:hypothetical protein
MSFTMVQNAYAQNENSQTQEQQEEIAPKEYVPFKDEAPLLALKKDRPTTPLEIASLFHKKAGTEPNFKLWAKENQKYLTAKEIDKNKVFTKVYSELVSRYRELPEDTMLNIQPIIHLGEYSEMQNIQVIKSLNEETFFTYDASGSNYAVIPSEMDRFHHLYMTAERHKEFLDKNKGFGGKVRGEIILKISQIDAEQPYELQEGTKFWLIAAEIAEIRLWTASEKKPRLLWRYKAPWFKGVVDRELMGLFEGKRNAVH